MKTYSLVEPSNIAVHFISLDFKLLKSQIQQHEITKIGRANTTRNKAIVCVLDAAVSKNTL